MSKKALDLTGKRFGRLIVIERTNKRDSNNRIIWRCKCDCGNEKYVSTFCLRSGHTASCGCILREAKGHTSETQILETKLSKNNKSGVKGVHWNNWKSKWCAAIGWKNKLYELMVSGCIDDCIAVRKEAEEAVRNGNFEEWIVAYKGRMAQ